MSIATQQQPLFSGNSAGRYQGRPRCSGCKTEFTEIEFTELVLLGRNYLRNIEVRKCSKCEGLAVAHLNGGS